MKFLNVIPYWGVEYGGPFVNVSNICVNLILKGHESSIITTSKAPGQYTSTFPWKIASQNVNLPFYVCKRLEDSFCFSGEFKRKFIEVAQKIDCVFIHGLWRFPTTFAAFFCRENNIPYCVFTHAMLTPWSLSQRKFLKEIYFKLIEKNNLNKANLIFTYSKEEFLFLKENKIKAEVFHFASALNREEIKASYKLKQEKNDLYLSESKTILYLSRIHPKKGLLLLVEAMKELVKMKINIRLLIAGPIEDLHYFKKVKNIIKKSELENNIIFKGLVEGDEKTRIFLESDIFVLPSEDEASSPLVVLEAMSFGLPIVVTIGCKMPEIDNKMGYVVENEPSRIAEAVLKLVNNKELAKTMGFKGHEYVLDNFSWEKKIYKLIEIVLNHCEKTRL